MDPIRVVDTTDHIKHISVGLPVLDVGPGGVEEGDGLHHVLFGPVKLGLKHIDQILLQVVQELTAVEASVQGLGYHWVTK